MFCQEVAYKDCSMWAYLVMQQTPLSAPVGEHVKHAAVNASKHFCRIQHWQFALAGQILGGSWCCCFENTIMCVLILVFCDSFGSMGNLLSIIPLFAISTPDYAGSISSHFLWLYRKVESLSNISMKFWAVCICITFCLLAAQNRDRSCTSQILVNDVLSLYLLIPYSSDILCNSLQLFNSICRHTFWGSTWMWFVIHGFLSLLHTFKPVIHTFFFCSLHLFHIPGKTFHVFQWLFFPICSKI